MASDLFSVEQLLEMEMEMEMVMEDPAALMVYESQLMSCINTNVVSIDTTSSSSSSLSSSSISEGWSALSAGADPSGKAMVMTTSTTRTRMRTSSTHDQKKYKASSTGSLKRSQVIAFGFGVSSDNDFEHYYDVNWSAELMAAPAKRNPSYSQDHVLVERRRREKLAHRFHQLRTLIPGLNTKTDKASIIEEAAKYIKQLQEQLKLLEQQQTMEKTEDATTNRCIQKTTGSPMIPLHDLDNVICSSSCVNEAPLEIDAKLSEDRDMVTIRIHSKLDYNLIPMILAELGKLHLKLLNSNVMPFGKYAMDTTLVVQMEDEFCMTVEELMKHMRLCLQPSSHT